MFFFASLSGVLFSNKKGSNHILLKNLFTLLNIYWAHNFTTTITRSRINRFVICSETPWIRVRLHRLSCWSTLPRVLSSCADVLMHLFGVKETATWMLLFFQWNWKKTRIIWWIYSETKIGVGIARGALLQTMTQRKVFNIIHFHSCTLALCVFCGNET